MIYPGGCMDKEQVGRRANLAGVVIRVWVSTSEPTTWMNVLVFFWLYEGNAKIYEELSVCKIIINYYYECLRQEYVSFY